MVPVVPAVLAADVLPVSKLSQKGFGANPKPFCLIRILYLCDAIRNVVNMKKLLLLSAILLGCAVSHAQPSTLARGEVYEGMKYREYKNLYDTHFYSREMGGAYSPGWSGVASFFIPGLGQAICGEWGRGLAMFGGHLALSFIYVAAINVGNTNYYVDAPPGIRSSYDGAYTLALIAMLGDAALDIWSICDAVHIAKVKNMYYHDLRGQRAAVDIKLEPYFAYTPTNIGKNQPATGLSLKLNF